MQTIFKLITRSRLTHHIFVLAIVHRRLLTVVGINVLSGGERKVNKLVFEHHRLVRNLHPREPRRLISASDVVVVGSWPASLAHLDCRSPFRFLVKKILQLMHHQKCCQSDAGVASPLSSSDRFGVTGDSFSAGTLSVEFCRRGADKFVVFSGS